MSYGGGAGAGEASWDGGPPGAEDYAFSQQGLPPPSPWQGSYSQYPASSNFNYSTTYPNTEGPYPAYNIYNSGYYQQTANYYEKYPEVPTSYPPPGNDRYGKDYSTRPSPRHRSRSRSPVSARNYDRRPHSMKSRSRSPVREYRNRVHSKSERSESPERKRKIKRSTSSSSRSSVSSRSSRSSLSRKARKRKDSHSSRSSTYSRRSRSSSDSPPRYKGSTKYSESKLKTKPSVKTPAMHEVDKDRKKYLDGEKEKLKSKTVTVKKERITPPKGINLSASPQKSYKRQEKTPASPKYKSRDKSESPPKVYKSKDRSATPPKKYKSRERSITPPKSYKTKERSITPPRRYRSKDVSVSPPRSYKITGKNKSPIRKRRGHSSSSDRSSSERSRSHRSKSRASSSGRSAGTPRRSRTPTKLKNKKTRNSRSKERSRRRSRSVSRSHSRDRKEKMSRSRSHSDSSRGQFTTADRKRYFKLYNAKKKSPSKSPAKEIKPEPPPGVVEPAQVDDIEYKDPPEVEGPNFADLPPPPDVLFAKKQKASGPICIKNDGSFLEMFKKMQEETKKSEASTSQTEETAKPEIKKPALPFIGKRRGGRVLKTGLVKKAKAIDEQLVDNTPKDAWSLYMQEVKKYRETSCEEERKTRPLVK